MLQLLDYSQRYLFISIDERVAPVIREVLQRKNVEIFSDDPLLKYFLPKEEALELNVQ